MARADLLISLVRAAATSDQGLVRRTVEAMIAEERAKHHSVLAAQMEKAINRNGSPPAGAEVIPTRSQPAHDLVAEVSPRRTLADLVLNATVRATVDELVQEYHRADLLRSYNLQPRNRVLLTGAPGNGKTSLAEALAEALMVPLIVVRYDGLITSYLGETAARLRRLFDVAHTRRCVLFFDEFDTLGKERGDIHETGEIKRVVSSLLLHIDDLPSHVVVVCATNHPELLDRAVWRRFQLMLELAPPTRNQIAEYFELHAQRLKFSLGYAPRTLADKLTGANYSDLEQFVADVARSYVLALPNADVKAIAACKFLAWKQRPRAQRSKLTRAQSSNA
jgi:SpoVK/Ycf46/Vps4 family AAA+-type ATPase